MTLPATVQKGQNVTGQRTVKIALRTACGADFVFARNLYFETMRGMIERLFGWDQKREERNFAGFFKVEEVRIIIADGQDVGWIQEQVEDRTVNLGSFYVLPAMQGRGIGTKVLDILLTRAAHQSKAMTLAVVKINPARYFYEKRGFRITHEDQHKFYMRADPKRPPQDN
ncbi:MAG TPA: GNAT family N-acetyltransferase [Terriglobales bacterium]|nr:GNAT family N-acetyltransferase [Terriglobales bacterium]